MTRVEIQQAYEEVRKERESYTGDDAEYRAELRDKMDQLSEQLTQFDREDMGA